MFQVNTLNFISNHKSNVESWFTQRHLCFRHSELRIATNINIYGLLYLMEIKHMQQFGTYKQQYIPMDNQKRINM